MEKPDTPKKPSSRRSFLLSTIVAGIIPSGTKGQSEPSSINDLSNWRKNNNEKFIDHIKYQSINYLTNLLEAVDIQIKHTEEELSSRQKEYDLSTDKTSEADLLKMKKEIDDLKQTLHYLRFQKDTIEKTIEIKKERSPDPERLKKIDIDGLKNGITQMTKHITAIQSMINKINENMFLTNKEGDSIIRMKRFMHSIEEERSAWQEELDSRSDNNNDL